MKFILQLGWAVALVLANVAQKLVDVIDAQETRHESRH